MQGLERVRRGGGRALQRAPALLRPGLPAGRSSARGASWHGARIAQRRAQSLAPAATKRGHGRSRERRCQRGHGTAQGYAARRCPPAARLAKTPQHLGGEPSLLKRGLSPPNSALNSPASPLHPAGSGAGAAQLGAAPMAPLRAPRPLGSDPPGTPRCRPRAPTWERGGRRARTRAARHSWLSLHLASVASIRLNRGGREKKENSAQGDLISSALRAGEKLWNTQVVTQD